MKLVSYDNDGQDQLAILVNGMLYDTDLLHPNLPGSMGMFLNYWEDVYPIALSVDSRIKGGKIPAQQGTSYDLLNILPPVPHPVSCRIGYAFRRHMVAARNSRNAEMIPEFDQYPVFSFVNHNSIQGEGEVTCMPDQLDKLDFELGAAIVICKPGRNIKAEDAGDYIGGYMIMNSLSARRLQAGEVLLDAGPAKGKDFATITGPLLVTPDELEPFKAETRPNHTGSVYNLPVKCRVNGVQVSEGNLADMEWTFAELIERCSYGVQLFPGDIIGSGAVDSGCFLDLNHAAKQQDPNYQEKWLNAGDTIEMEIEGLGRLSNTIVKEESDFSILALKK